MRSIFCLVVREPVVDGWEPVVDGFSVVGTISELGINRSIMGASLSNIADMKEYTIDCKLATDNEGKFAGLIPKNFTSPAQGRQDAHEAGMKLFLGAAGIGPNN